MAVLWMFVILIGLFFGGAIGLWPWIVRYELEGDVIRALSLSVPLLGAIVLWYLKNEEELRREERARERRQRRLLVALHAETQMHFDELIEQFALSHIPTIRSGFRRNVDRAEAGQTSMPVGVVPKENDVFDRIKVELSELPDEVVGPVIRYYQADEYVVEMIKAFNSKAFESKPASDRKDVLDQYILMGIDALMRCFTVLDSLNEALYGTSYPFSPERQKARTDIQAFLENGDRLGDLPSDDDDRGKEAHVDSDG